MVGVSMSRLWINIIAFQAVWFVSVVYGNGPALVSTIIAMLIHVKWVMQDQREWLLIAAVIVFGFIWDSLMTVSGVLVFSPEPATLIPLWLICLWALFATTLTHALAWLKHRLIVSALLGAIFGPLSYWAGTRLSSTEFGLSLEQSLIVLAFGWMLIMPLAVLLTRRVVRYPA